MHGEVQTTFPVEFVSNLQGADIFKDLFAIMWTKITLFFFFLKWQIQELWQIPDLLAADVWNAQVTINIFTVFRVADVLFFNIVLRDWFINKKDVNLMSASTTSTGWWAVGELDGQDFQVF